MPALKLQFLKEVLHCSAVAVALLGLVGITSPARANTLCPNAANQNGSGAFTFTPVAGPLDSTCGANSAISISIPAETDYARLMWDSTVANYPAGLTLGNLAGLSAAVPAFTGQPGDQPFYMLAFTDLTGGLGQTLSTDQILMIEFQPTTLSGANMVFDPNATLVNLFDNDTGVYLAGGQADTQTLAGWLSADPFLATESLQQVRLAIGLAGGGANSESITVNSLDITTTSPGVPEPTSFCLVSTVMAAVGWSIRRRQLRNRRG